jgi:hypothetical protein
MGMRRENIDMAIDMLSELRDECRGTWGRNKNVTIRNYGKLRKIHKI